MILTKNVDVKIINHNINHYKNLGYKVNYFDTINVPVDHLTKGSHIEIYVKCDKCDYKRKIRYDHYNQRKINGYLCPKCTKIYTSKILFKKYGVYNISQSNKIKEKKKKTNIKNWGVENVFQSEIIKNKSKKTIFEKYGVNHIRKSQYFINISKKTRINNGNQISDDELSEFQLYKRKVNTITRKLKKELFEKWDGYDFYDGEYIKNNKNYKDKCYPSIDHKISIYNGFKNKIDPYKIGNMNNLCITKKYLNSSKSFKNYTLDNDGIG
jgi:ribosomal protein S26